MSKLQIIWFWTVRYTPWRKCEVQPLVGRKVRTVYVSDYVCIYTAGKKWHRGKLNCVGLALINAIVSQRNSLPEIASSGSSGHTFCW